jgi:protein involved in polysaccharide export with SLBB domain
MLKTHLVTIVFSFLLSAGINISNADSFNPFDMGQVLNLRMDNGLNSQTNKINPQQNNKVNNEVLLNAQENLANLPYSTPQQNDYKNNLTTDVFGANLFTGAFAKQGATQFNPNYVVAVGDQIQVRLWGAFTFEDILTVDPKGNIFVPHAGPVQVLGVKNNDLQKLTENAVKKVFKTNVFAYASLAAAQPVRVLVTGNVYRPGLYRGTSMDSLLHYLDQSGGIDVERGSFLSVIVKRGEQVRFKANLYDFLINGNMPLIQLADGDVIFISPRGNTVKVSGLADNAKRFEFDVKDRTMADLITLAKPKASATHIRVIRNTGTIKNIEYYPINEANKVILQNGDDIEFTADKKPGTITVRIEGEHISAQEYVLPYGSKIGDLLNQIEYSDRSDKDSIQLFRASVKERQKQMLRTSLKSLEAAALTARSGTNDEARLRKEEADLILQWIDRAKEIEPTGQVVIAQSESKDDLLLENGDILKVPTRDGLVLISGEVLFPNAIAYGEKLNLDDYVKKAGGYTQNADSARIVVARRDGSFAEASGEKGFFRLMYGVPPIQAGDEILVLPKIDVKSRQIFKELTQILFQIAVSARVVFGL